MVKLSNVVETYDIKIDTAFILMFERIFCQVGLVSPTASSNMVPFEQLLNSPTDDTASKYYNPWLLTL